MPRTVTGALPRQNQGPETVERDGRQQVARAVGDTVGDAEVTSDQVKTKKDTVECPNCHRVWPVSDRHRGTTIPCLCDFLISVA